MDHFLKALQMGGYATYVWSAYGLVLSTCALQWLLPWLWLKKTAKRQQAAGK